MCGLAGPTSAPTLATAHASVSSPGYRGLAPTLPDVIHRSATVDAHPDDCAQPAPADCDHIGTAAYDTSGPHPRRVTAGWQHDERSSTANLQTDPIGAPRAGASIDGNLRSIALLLTAVSVIRT